MLLEGPLATEESPCCYRTPLLLEGPLVCGFWAPLLLQGSLVAPGAPCYFRGVLLLEDHLLLPSELLEEALLRSLDDAFRFFAEVW